VVRKTAPKEALGNPRAAGKDHPPELESDLLEKRRDR
jgi:hypothetical protein